MLVHQRVIAMKFMFRFRRGVWHDHPDGMQSLGRAPKERNVHRKWGSLRKIDDPVTIGLYYEIYYFILFYTYHPNLSEKTQKKYPMDFFQWKMTFTYVYLMDEWIARIWTTWIQTLWLQNPAPVGRWKQYHSNTTVFNSNAKSHYLN